MAAEPSGRLMKNRLGAYDVSMAHDATIHPACSPPLPVLLGKGPRMPSPRTKTYTCYTPRPDFAIEEPCRSACRRAPDSNPPPAWHASQWFEAERIATKTGDFSQVRNLHRSVLKGSRQALEQQRFRCESGALVNLSEHITHSPCAYWYGRANADIPPASEEDDVVAPPLIVACATPLEVIAHLTRARACDEKLISVAIDISDFDKDGKVSLDPVPGMSAMQQELLLCSNFCKYAGAAAGGSLRNSACPTKSHLTATDDPYVFKCPDMTIFRGPRKDGYPFLPQPTRIDAIITAMPHLRPQLDVGREGTRTTQWYALEKDRLALVERLRLVGLVALGNSRESKAVSGVLILSMLGCCSQGCHPRDDVAIFLKHWRNCFARHFHCVIIACGPDDQLAEFVDDTVNADIYELGRQGNELSCKWHWDSRFVQLHINTAKLFTIGSPCNPQIDIASKLRPGGLAADSATQDCKQRSVSTCSSVASGLPVHAKLKTGSNRGSTCSSFSRVSLPMLGRMMTYDVNSLGRQNNNKQHMSMANKIHTAHSDATQKCAEAVLVGKLNRKAAAIGECSPREVQAEQEGSASSSLDEAMCELAQKKTWSGLSSTAENCTWTAPASPSSRVLDGGTSETLSTTHSKTEAELHLREECLTLAARIENRCAPTPVGELFYVAWCLRAGVVEGRSFNSLERAESYFSGKSKGECPTVLLSHDFRQVRSSGDASLFEDELRSWSERQRALRQPENICKEEQCAARSGLNLLQIGLNNFERAAKTKPVCPKVLVTPETPSNSKDVSDVQTCETQIGNASQPPSESALPQRQPTAIPRRVSLMMAQQGLDLSSAKRKNNAGSEKAVVPHRKASVACRHSGRDRSNSEDEEDVSVEHCLQQALAPIATIPE